MKIQIHNETGEVVFFPKHTPTPQEGFTTKTASAAQLLTIQAGGPFKWEGDTLVKTTRPAIVPHSISRYQFIAQLRADGILTAAKSAAAGDLRDAFENKTDFRRTDTHANALLTALGFSENQADSFFINAATIN